MKSVVSFCEWCFLLLLKDPLEHRLKRDDISKVLIWFGVRRFRPNIVVEYDYREKNDFIENSWVGKKLTIGKDSAQGHSTLYYMCDDNSATRRPSQRFRYLEHSSKV